MRIRLTDKGRALFQRLKGLEMELAAIWREPFETYDSARRLDWSNRRTAAQASFDQAMTETLGDLPEDPGD